jgi:hypothetical protein
MILLKNECNSERMDDKTNDYVYGIIFFIYYLKFNQFKKTI